MKLRLFAPALLLALSYGITQADVALEDDHGPLEFAHIELPPLGYEGETGESEGYLVELAERVFRAMGVPVRYRTLPASRVYNQMETGETDITMGVRGLSESRDFSYKSAEPVIDLNLAVYYREGTAPVQSVNDLKGQRLVLMRGYSYGRLAPFLADPENGIQRDYTGKHDSALNMLLFERADYLLTYEVAAETFIAERELKELHKARIGDVPVHLFVSDEHPQARELIEAWDHHFEQLRSEGGMPDREQFAQSE